MSLAARVIFVVAGVVMAMLPVPVFAGQHAYVGTRDAKASAEIAVSPDGVHVYTPAGDGIGLSVRSPVTGALTATGEATPPGTISGAHAVVSGDGKHVYATQALSGGPVFVFDRDSGTGALTPAGTIGSFGAGALAMSPDDQNVYVLDGNADAIVVYSRDALSGALTFVEGHTDGVGGVDGLAGPSDVAVSPDGANVYVVGKFDNAVAAFSRDLVTGSLTFLELKQDGVAGVDGLGFTEGVDVSPDGAHVYAVGGSEFGPAVFARDNTTGALTFVQYDEHNPLLNAPVDVKVSPDGTHVYLAAAFPFMNGGDLVAVFDRNPGTGEVTLRQTFQNEVGGFQLTRPFGIAGSPDGQFVYVTGQGQGAIATFRHAQVECSATPLGGCFQAGKSKLVMTDGTPDTKDKLAWKWLEGEAVTLGDFGDPAATLNDYAVCLYDGTGPLLEGLAAAGGGCGSVAAGGATPCWKQKDVVGFTYKSRLRSPHGISPVKLTAGGAGAARVTAKGKGENLPFPALPLTPPVTIQLQNTNGGCWESTFPAAIVNDGLTFKAQAD